MREHTSGVITKIAKNEWVTSEVLDSPCSNIFRGNQKRIIEWISALIQWPQNTWETETETQKRKDRRASQCGRMPVHTYARAPPSKKQQFLAVTYNFHSVLAIKGTLLRTHTHTQQARLLVHPLKWKTCLFGPYESHCRLPWKHPATLVYLPDSQTNSRHHSSIPQTSRKVWQDEGRSVIKLWYMLHNICVCVCLVQEKRVRVPWCWSPRHSGWFGRAVGNEACSAGCTVGRISPEWMEEAQWKSAGFHRRSTSLNLTFKL